MILSPSDLLLFNSGQGDIWQKEKHGEYSVWKDIINNFEIFPQGVDRNRILGGEVVLEGFLSNEDTLENNLWPRAAAFAYKVWTNQKIETYQVVEGLVNVKKVLEEIGVQPSPVTSEFCEGKPHICWPSEIQIIDSMIQ